MQSRLDLPASVGWACNVLFLLTIPVANVWLHHYGFWHWPLLGPVASGVVWVGLAFVLRDVAQLLLGKWWTLPAIAIGALLSWWLASPMLALASGAAFGVSELMDWSIYTPLAQKGKFTTGIVVSGYVGSIVDSSLFLWIAFGSFTGWWQLALVKALVLMAVTPLARLVRARLAPQPRIITITRPYPDPYLDGIGYP